MTTTTATTATTTPSIYDGATLDTMDDVKALLGAILDSLCEDED